MNVLFRVLINLLAVPLINLIIKPVKANISNYCIHLTKKQTKKLIKVSGIDGVYDIFFVTTKQIELAYTDHNLPLYILNESSKKNVYFAVRISSEKGILSRIFIIVDKLHQEYGDGTDYKINLIKAIYAGCNMFTLMRKSIISMDKLPYMEVNKFADDLLDKLCYEKKLNFILT